MRLINGNYKKGINAAQRILKEFFQTWRHFSFSLAIYRISWWIGYYIPRFNGLYKWSNEKKRVYITNFFNENFRDITNLYRAEQSRAEQSRAEQSRAEQSRAEQSRACFGI